MVALALGAAGLQGDLRPGLRLDAQVQGVHGRPGPDAQGLLRRRRRSRPTSTSPAPTASRSTRRTSPRTRRSSPLSTASPSRPAEPRQQGPAPPRTSPSRSSTRRPATRRSTRSATSATSPTPTRRPAPRRWSAACPRSSRTSTRRSTTTTSTVFPVAAVLIMVILGLLLRSVVAPWYLMASVGLGFGATLGATVLIFQKGAGHRADLHAAGDHVPVRGRHRHRLQHPDDRPAARGGPGGPQPREAAGRRCGTPAPRSAAAGFILAATFATLMLAGNALLTEMGFAVSFGIVVAAFVMAMFFTPEPHRADRPRRMVAGACGPGQGGGRSRLSRGVSCVRLTGRPAAGHPGLTDPGGETAGAPPPQR